MERKFPKCPLRVKNRISFQVNILWIQFYGQYVDRIEKKYSELFEYRLVNEEVYWLSNNCKHFENVDGVNCFAGFNVKPHYENGVLGVMF